MSEPKHLEELIEVSAAVDTLAISKAEIDLQIATAKSYPRSLTQFQKSAMEMVTYSREAAEKMFYVLPRGGKMIEGPSVRLAEIIGQNWRNCRIGARVLGNDDRTVTSQGVFHDLETNVAISFEIKRRITRKDGTRYDDDMIGVTGAAAAGIAFRNAVLKGIPKLFWQPLYEKAMQTARGDDKDIAPRRKAALEEFSKMGVPEAAVLKVLGVTGTSKIGPDQLVTLRGIFNAIREGSTTPVEAFDLGPKPIEPTTELVDKLQQSIEMVNAAKNKPGREKKKPPSKPPKAAIPPHVAIPPAKLEDPFLATKQQTEIYHAASQVGWRIPEELNAMLLKHFKVKSLREVRASQFDAVMQKVKTGT
jgi:hypothetical protein